MKLVEIFEKRGIKLFNGNGEVRNAIDIIEDMYLKLSTVDFVFMMREIEDDEKEVNVFDEARGGKYNGN